jgi:hypothetical protein
MDENRHAMGMDKNVILTGCCKSVRIWPFLIAMIQERYHLTSKSLNYICMENVTP